MNTAHICIARHGETDWNKSGILQGWLDVPLNDLGRHQAHELAASLADAGLAAVWGSTLVRSSETADIVAKALALPPPVCHLGLRERHFGAIQGVPKGELAELNPTQFEQILRRNPQVACVGGESMDEFADRVLNAFGHIGSCHPSARVLVITHGWVMDVITRHISGLPRSAVLHIKRKNGECVWFEAAQGMLEAAG
jgi:probable phosphoglycerate mutase